ncbi:MAG TPA: nuclear transport factor 2 family protein [Devosia sp.]|nr:nuclear transport factor 2 family protein [Devosia sp.]
MDTETFVRSFLAAIEQDRLIGHEDDWYTTDAEQIEWPNRLAPNGARRTLSELKDAGLRGRAIIDTQRYEVMTLLSEGGRVAVEAIFRATFKIDVAGLRKGETMQANFAMFFELQGGKIRRHRTYDCFQPW